MEGFYFDGRISTADSLPNQLIVLNKKRFPEITDLLKAELNDDERNRLNLVEKLIDGFESPAGLELLASVLWAIRDLEEQTSAELVVRYLQEWSPSLTWNLTLDQRSVGYFRVREFFPDLVQSVHQ